MSRRAPWGLGRREQRPASDSRAEPPVGFNLLPNLRISDPVWAGCWSAGEGRHVGVEVHVADPAEAAGARNRKHGEDGSDERRLCRCCASGLRCCTA
jgi:hypothetical protein